MLGASVPRTQMAPSSRWGRNSEPMTPLKARKIIKAKASKPAPSVNFMWSKHQSSVAA